MDPVTGTLDQLAVEAGRIVRCELTGHNIRQIWTEGSRILFQLTDGRTGDVEVFVNWDVGLAPKRRGDSW